MRPPGGRVASVSGQRQQETHHADAGHALQEHEVGVPRLRVAGNAQQSRGHAALVRIVRLVALLVPLAPLHPQATITNLNGRPAHKLSHKWAACVCQVAKGACVVGRTLTARESARRWARGWAGEVTSGSRTVTAAKVGCFWPTLPCATPRISAVMAAMRAMMAWRGSTPLSGDA